MIEKKYVKMKKLQNIENSVNVHCLGLCDARKCSATRAFGREDLNAGDDVISYSEINGK